MEDCVFMLTEYLKEKNPRSFQNMKETDQVQKKKKKKKKKPGLPDKLIIYIIHSKAC